MLIEDPEDVLGPWVYISKGRAGLLSNINLVIDSRQKIRFWEDVWVGERTQSESFPRLYGLSLGQLFYS